MFEKKTVDAQPVSPTFNQILEDLRESEAQGYSLPSPSEVLGTKKDPETDAENSVANKHYETIKKLVEDSSNLEEILQQLKKTNNALKNQYEELKDMTAAVKERGASALN